MMHFRKQASAVIIHSSRVSAKTTIRDLGATPSAKRPRPIASTRLSTSLKVFQRYSPMSYCAQGTNPGESTNSHTPTAGYVGFLFKANHLPPLRTSKVPSGALQGVMYSRICHLRVKLSARYLPLISQKWCVFYITTSAHLLIRLMSR